jgi:hypothetical protein
VVRHAEIKKAKGYLKLILLGLVKAQHELSQTPGQLGAKEGEEKSK